MGRLRGFVAPLKKCSSKEPSEEGGEVEPFDAVTSELARCSSSYNLHATDRALMPCQMQPGQNKPMFYPDIKIVTLEPSCLRYLCSQTISPNLLLSNTDPNPAILVGSMAERSLFYQLCVLVILVGASAILVLIHGRTVLVLPVVCACDPCRIQCDPCSDPGQNDPCRPEGKTSTSSSFPQTAPVYLPSLQRTCKCMCSPY